MENKVRYELIELEKSFSGLKSLISEIDSGDKDRYRVISLAVMIRDIYSGIERIIRYRLMEKGHDIPNGNDWHVRLLGMAFEHSLISGDDYKSLRLILSFRHRFNNGYSHNLDIEKLVPMAKFLLDLESRSAL